MPEVDRVNLLIDAWALVEASRKPLSHYLDLVDQVVKEEILARTKEWNASLGDAPLRTRGSAHE